MNNCYLFLVIKMRLESVPSMSWDGSRDGLGGSVEPSKVKQTQIS